MKILIIQTAYIGDCVLTLPLINTLKKIFDSKITILTTPAAKDIFTGCRSVDELMIYDKKGVHRGLKSFVNLVRKLKKVGFEIAFLPQRSFRSGLITLLAGIPRRIGFKRGGSRFFLTDKIDFDWNIHEVERQLGLASAAGCKEVIRDFNLTADKTLVEKYRNMLSNGKKIVGVCSQSKWQTKKWPIERFRELIEVLSGANQIVMLGREREKFNGEDILNWTGRTTVKELIAVISLLDVLVSNDTGLIHIAAAMGVSVVAIFGPTVPEMGFSPYGAGHTVIEVPLDCRPCGLHGGGKCPKGHFKCMLNIPVERVIGEVEKII